MVKTFEEFITESAKWTQGGILLLLGKKLKSGKKKLFIVRAKNVSTLQRANLPAEMVNLYPDIYIVREENGKLVGKQIMYDDKTLKNSLGLSSLNIVLNKNKTPYWRNTILETDLNKVLREMQSVIKGIEDIEL